MVTTGAWYTDPALWASVANAVGAYASSTNNKGGTLDFKRQPETPEEKAYRLWAERLAGVPDAQGNLQPGSMPTYNYLMPQIDASLRNIANNSAAYQGLERLDPATGKPIPRTVVQQVMPDFASGAAQWGNIAAGFRGTPPTATNVPGGVSTITPGAGRHGEGTNAGVGEGVRGVRYRDWVGGGDYRNNLSNPNPVDSGMTPGSNASLDPKNPTLYRPPGSTGSPSMFNNQGPPPGMSYQPIDLHGFATYLKENGWKDGLRVAVGFMSGGLTGAALAAARAAWDAYQRSKATGGPTPQPTGGAGAGQGGPTRYTP